MAQVRAAGRAGAGDFEFAPALAKVSAAQCLVPLARVARSHSDLRGAATTLVSRLVSALVADGILFQPVHRSLCAAGIFYFHPDAARICVAVGGQGFLATQASIQRDDLLASSRRVQSIGPAFLKREFEAVAVAVRG